MLLGRGQIQLFCENTVFIIYIYNPIIADPKYPDNMSLTDLFGSAAWNL